MGLHFAPLAHLVTVRAYYFAAACCSLIAIAALRVPEASLSPAGRTAGVGIGMGAVIWITAAYAWLRADTLVLAGKYCGAAARIRTGQANRLG